MTNTRLQTTIHSWLHISKLVIIITAMAVLQAGFGMAVVQAGTFTWTNGNETNKWTDPGNWTLEDVGKAETRDYKSDGYPSIASQDAGDTALINRSGEDYVMIREGDNVVCWEMRVGVGEDTTGKLAITGGRVLVKGSHRKAIIGNSGGTGIVNQSGGTFRQHRNSLNIGGGSSAGTWNLSGGRFGITRGPLNISNNGRVHITGGWLSVKGVHLGSGGTFRVAGSAINKMKVRRSNWHQAAGGVLDVGIDAGAPTTIRVRRGGGATFKKGALLNVGFLDGNERVGSWDLMTWMGELSDNGLRFADSVDKETWNAHFVDTDDDGSPDTLRVNAVPNRADRIASVRELSGEAPAKAVESLLTVLKAKSVDDRLAAVETLREMGPDAAPALSAPEAEPAIEVMLNQRSLRKQAIETVLAAGVFQIETLALQYEDARVRVLAVKRIEDPDLLRRIATDQNEKMVVREAAGNKIPGTYWRFPVKTQKTYSLPQGAHELDRIVFGSKPSEQAHQLAPETSRVIEEKDGKLARTIMNSKSNDLGSMSFTMDCHPSKRTYLTIKQQSDPDENAEFLLLFDDDDNIISYNYPWMEASWPRVESYGHKTKHSEWWYSTMRLPTYLTEGNDRVELRLVNMPKSNGPSPPLYRAYTHTDPLFNQPADETGITDVPTGNVAGPVPEDEYLTPLIEEINKKVRSNIRPNGNVSPRHAMAIALAYSRGDWIDSVDQDPILEAVKSTIDRAAITQIKKGGPGNMWRGRRSWHHHGALAQAFSLLHEEFTEAGLLEETVPGHPEGDVTRRQAYTDFFVEALEWRARLRNAVYNQFMIISLGLVRMSRALEKLNPDRAPSQKTVDRWIDEAIGLEGVTPHPDTPKDWVQRNFGTGSYHMASEAGTFKEHGGYVAKYGGVGMTYTMFMAYETGLERVKDRLVQMVRARGAMAWLAEDGEGHRKAAANGSFGSRGVVHLLGNNNQGYGRMPLLNWLAAPHDVTRRWAELALEHGRKPGTWRLHQNILQVDAYRKLQHTDASEHVVPMNRERYIWSDEDIGLVSIIDGDTQIQMDISHHTKPVGGVQKSAWVHYHGPKGDRVISMDVDRLDYPFNGQVWERPDRTRSFSSVPWKEGKVIVHQALAQAGRAPAELQQASQPDGDPWPWHRRATGIHYRQVQVGRYLIGMNSTGAPEHGFGPDREYEMEVPGGTAVNVASGENITADSITVGPRETIVLKIEKR